MMSKSIYISTLHPRSGSLVVAIGLMEILKGHFGKVAYFRPIVSSGCENISFMINHFKLDMSIEDASGYSLDSFKEAFSHNTQQELIDNIVAKVQKLYERYDFVLIEGYASESLARYFDTNLNLTIASALTSLIIPVFNGYNKTVDELYQEYLWKKTEISKTNATIIALFFNRTNQTQQNQLTKLLKSNDENVYFIPHSDILIAPTILDILHHTKSNLIIKPKLNKIIKSYTIATMQVNNFIQSISNQTLIITSSDRIDIILSTIALQKSQNHPYISAILIYGKKIDDEIVALLRDSNIALLHTQMPIIEIIKSIESIKPSLIYSDEYKINIAKALFEKSQIDTQKLFYNISTKAKDVLTPSMFKYQILKSAQQNRQTILLPESDDDRVLIATHQILQRDIAHIILLGIESQIQAKAKELHLDISGATIIDINQSPYIQKFANRYYQLRKHKGITKDQAKEIVAKPNYFGVMMVEFGLADGMVSGANHTTADTIRPALEILGTCSDTPIVSSLFFMGLDSGVVVFSDCAINIDPNANELATIAISSAKSAKAFGIEPKIALLSYSSGDSGKGDDVDKVKKALNIVKSKQPNLIIDGPIQYDSAVDKSVANKKMPHSQVAGCANVFIFPDLNSGNNTYKAVQRTSGGFAIGPILQGLKKPVNDLSRGCSVEDIIDTIIVTSIIANNSKA
jgi:phosphate acetyltransferase